MITFQRIFLSIFLSTGTAWADLPQLTARQALIKMNNAMQALNFQGTVAFFRNNKLETMKYYHAVKNGHRQERLLSLNSPLREVVRESGRVSCRFNDKRPLVVDNRPYENSFLIDLPKNLGQTDTAYQLELVGEEDIAMLPSYVIDIKSPDEYRYNRKVWVEKNKFLPLKVAVLDPAGSALEEIVFTDQQVLDQISFVQLKLPEPMPRKPAGLTEAVSFNDVPFTINKLPAGFESVFFTQRPMHDRDQMVDHLVLSDGFAMVSIYMEKADPDMEAGIHSVGAINSFSRNLSDRFVTVMGEVPAVTVKLIAEGINLKSDSGH